MGIRACEQVMVCEVPPSNRIRRKIEMDKIDKLM